MVEAGRRFAASAGTDSMLAVGGGSSLDCAKGLNFVLTNGGSDAGLSRRRQGHAADASADRGADHGRHRQRGAAVRADFGCRDARQDGVRRSERMCFKVDPQCGPHRVAAGDISAVVGMDAISHAVESFVTTRRTSVRTCSRTRRGCCCRRAMRESSTAPDDLEARGLHASRSAPGWARDRAVHARRDPCVRQPADGSIRYPARRRHSRHAASCDPVERGPRRQSVRRPQPTYRWRGIETDA